MSYVLEEGESSIIINEKALLDDTIEGILKHTNGKFTIEQIKEYLDEGVMSSVVEAMFDAQTNEIIELAKQIEKYNFDEEAENQLEEDIIEYQKLLESGIGSTYKQSKNGE